MLVSGQLNKFMSNKKSLTEYVVLLLAMKTSPLLASRRSDENLRVLQLLPLRLVCIIPKDPTTGISTPVAV